MAALLIFIATYVVLALSRFPGLRVDRTGAAAVGASCMVAAGVGAPLTLMSLAFGAAWLTWVR
ncbi:MAG TPA: hypothetical protein VGK29_25000 [Paludibaculum sp.]|jgi:hypothetical protein